MLAVPSDMGKFALVNKGLYLASVLGLMLAVTDTELIKSYARSRVSGNRPGSVKAISGTRKRLCKRYAAMTWLQLRTWQPPGV